MLELQQILSILGSADYLFNEDFQLMQAQLACALNLVAYFKVFPDVLAGAAQAAQARMFLLIAAVVEKFSAQNLFSANNAQIAELLKGGCDTLFVRSQGEILPVFEEFFAQHENLLHFASALALLQLDAEVVKTDRLVQKCQVFGRFLRLARRFDFADRNAQRAVNLGVKLLKVAADFERNPAAIRGEALTCVLALLENVNLQEDQILFLLGGAFQCATWKHGARSPDCLVRATLLLKLLVGAQLRLGRPFEAVQGEKSSAAGATFDRILTRCCVQAEDDWAQVREATLELVGVFLDYLERFSLAGAPGEPLEPGADELGARLAQRLDDANERVTLRALALLGRLLGLGNDLQMTAQIAETVVTHCDDPNSAIRDRCRQLAQQLRDDPRFRDAAAAQAQKMNWQFPGGPLWQE